MKRLIFIIPIILIISAVLYLVIRDNNPPQNSAQKIKIVAVENFYGQIAAQIGGDKVEVINILNNPDLDPHEYETTSNDAKSISDSQIVIENGLGYDSFIDKLLASAGGKEVIDVGQLAGLTDGDNPHLWYNIDYIKTFAIKVRNELMKIDIENNDYYRRNYLSFTSSLDSITTICQSISVNYNGTKVVATEPVADYLLASCGLNSVNSRFQKAIEEGTDPAINDISDFENLLTNQQVKVLIYNKQTPTQITEKEKALAISNGIPVVGVSETMPEGSTYVSWLTSELTDLNNALKQ